MKITNTAARVLAALAVGSTLTLGGLAVAATPATAAEPVRTAATVSVTGCTKLADVSIKLAERGNVTAAAATARAADRGCEVADPMRTAFLAELVTRGATITDAATAWQLGQTAIGVLTAGGTDADAQSAVSVAQGDGDGGMADVMVTRTVVAAAHTVLGI